MLQVFSKLDPGIYLWTILFLCVIIRRRSQDTKDVAASYKRFYDL